MYTLQWWFRCPLLIEGCRKPPLPAPKKGAPGPQIHKLTEPGEGAIGADLAEGEEKAEIGALQPAAAAQDAPKAAGRGQGTAQRAWAKPC